MIKHVFIDLDDTILDFRKGERIAINKTFLEIGIEPTEEIIQKYLQINNECWRAFERGEMTRYQVLHERFERILPEFAVDFPPEQAQKIYEGFLSKEHDYLPGGLEMLEQFKKEGKYRLYMATNGTPEVQKPRIRDTGIAQYFSKIFISEEVGYAKPDKRFFEKCFEQIEDLKIEETIMVGDSLSSDIGGGINAGILTCHYNPNGKDYGDVVPNYKIKNLSELIPLLDGIK